MTVAIRFELLKVGHCTHPECVAHAGGRWRAVRFPALVALLVHPDAGPMLFDTGYAEAFRTATRPFPERLYRWTTPLTLAPHEALTLQLARRGYAAADIRGIVLSHLHADHVAGLVDFPDTRLYATRVEVDDLRRRSRFGRLRHAYLSALLPDDFDRRVRFVDALPRIPLPTTLQPFTDGFDLLGDGSLVAVPLPGHTAGQIGLTFRAETGRDVFLVADACWSLAALDRRRPPTWLAERLFADRRHYRATFDRLCTLRERRGDLLIVPSHCDASWARMVNDAAA